MGRCTYLHLRLTTCPRSTQVRPHSQVPDAARSRHSVPSFCPCLNFPQSSFYQLSHSIPSFESSLVAGHTHALHSRYRQWSHPSRARSQRTQWEGNNFGTGNIHVSQRERYRSSEVVRRESGECHREHQPRENTNSERIRKTVERLWEGDEA
ncbi:hypothetical protein EDB86DRAFT_876143 [Lactarius hatsudake]|nr:hypothetical protein EDB86DRAFT_876143 [Lactarius hatsudake]